MSAEVATSELVPDEGTEGRLRVAWLGALPESGGLDVVAAGSAAELPGLTADVVHVNGPGFDLAAVRAAAPRAAIVLDLGSGSGRRPGRRERRQIELADLVIVPRAEHLAALGGALARRAAVIPPPLDLDRYAPLEQLARERTQDARLKRFRRVHRLAGPTVLFAGPYTSAGRLDLLLEVVFALRERVPDLRLAAVPHGAVDEKFLDACERRALGLGHHGVIEWNRVEDELPLWYALCTVVCSPGVADAEAAAFAAAAGRPYVASTDAAAADALRDGNCGHVVPAGSSDELQAAIEAVVGDAEEAARLGANARGRAERELGTAAYEERIRRLWDEAVEGRAGSGAGGISVSR